jgi:hypothetical protein
MELDQDGTIARIGVEVTELTCDRRRLDAWRRVEERLRATAKTRPELQGVRGGIRFVDGKLPPKKGCGALANELTEFATAQNVKSGDELDFGNPFGAGYPVMNQFVQELVLWNRGHSIWQCADLAVEWASLSVPSLEKAINDKARKAEDYGADGLDPDYALAHDDVILSGSEESPIALH